MSVFEEKGVLTYKDKDGNLHRLYPATDKDSVLNMEYVDAHIEATDNPHKLKPATIGAVSKEDDIATLAEVKSFLGIA